MKITLAAITTRHLVAFELTLEGMALEKSLMCYPAHGSKVAFVIEKCSF